MENKRKNEINNILNKAKWFLGIGVVIILVMPFLLTRQYFNEKFNLSTTGQIGDTIGGITSPFLNLLGAFLVFYALKAQVKANELIQEQIDKDNELKDCENESQNLNQLYSYLNESINSFRFKTLPTGLLRNLENIGTETEFYGGDAFYHLFSQIRCHYHGSQEVLHSHQPVSELLSVLKIMDLLLEKLQNSRGKNKEILLTLVKHLFDYKIITRVRNENIEQLQPMFCEECQIEHGLPEEMRFLIGSIRQKLN